MSMKQKPAAMISALILTGTLLGAPSFVRAQSASGQEAEGVFVLGSVLLSILHVPYKLVTCAGTQAGAAVLYTTTFGVRGHYDGGTNGRDIGETARRSCTGDWIVTPQQVKEDYGS
jgi:hypothetical protein